MKELKAKIGKVYENIQHLQIQPTKTNTMLMAECFIMLEEVYEALPDNPVELDLNKDEHEETEETEETEDGEEDSGTDGADA